MFKNQFLHGHGKRVNPNSIIEYGIFNSGSFNKASSIEYSTELFEIIEIKNITFDEKRRKFNYAAQLKIKSDNGGSKSKSNIEKHFSRSKGNKQTE